MTNAEYLLASVIDHLKDRVEFYELEKIKKYDDPYVNAFNEGVLEGYKESLRALGAIPPHD